MAGSLRYAACSALATQLAALVPALDNIEVLDQPPQTVATYPVVVIQPDRFQWTPWQPSIVRDSAGAPVIPAAGRPLMEVGHYRGSIRLWVAGRNPAEREDLEDSLMRAFNQEHPPGRLQVTLSDIEVDGIATGWDAPIRFLLDGGAEWREELVFSARRWSFIGVDTMIPVFVLRSGEHKVTDMTIVFDEDLDATITGDTYAEQLDSIEGEELVSVEEA